VVTPAEAPDRVALEGRVWAALSAVPDPEIPPCSITDLGIVERVTVTVDAVEVELLPTFAGCPALDVIGEDAEAAVMAVASGREVRVRFVYSPPWTSDRISSAGRAALRAYGISPPRGPTDAETVPVLVPIEAVHAAEPRGPCPFCGSDDTVLESAFGPTLCRATRFCRSCRNPFESFKPK
jgi:ring-1,2-phenylacetyl-CoA epoxidase subunit PaaD